MANSGAGTKFVSVNLNKSYGQPSHHHHHHTPSSTSYGQNRTRTGIHSGGGGGMVVLSRPRSSQKAGSKLSVPPPLNLPSLRKEHERFDSLGSGGAHSGGNISGSGPRPSSSGVGWTKPAAVAIQDKEGFAGDSLDDVINHHGLHSVDGASKEASGVYTPPSARLGAVAHNASAMGRSLQPVEKVSVLRGEDFPSLQATLPASSGVAQKERDGLNHRQKQVGREELSNERKKGSSLEASSGMRSQFHGHNSAVNESSENRSERYNLHGSRVSEPAKKQEHLLGPLPLVKLNPRFDWADDERDTSHGLTDIGRDPVYPKNEAFWDRDFDMPRATFLPQKPAHNHVNKWGQCDNETRKVSLSGVIKAESYNRDVRISNDGWEAGNDRNGTGVRSSSMSRIVSKDNKYIPNNFTPSSFQDNAHGDVGSRDVSYGQGGRQPWSNKMEPFNNGAAEWNARKRYGNEQHNSMRGDAFRNNPSVKSYFPFGGKGHAVNAPILRERRPYSMSEKPYLDDPFGKDMEPTGFDGRDSYFGSLVGVVKKKKEVLNQTNYHDPIRESFEAELERVQKMQEEERQRIIEEQERTMEQARREEEERMRFAREQEERQRKLEEETREAAWRAEQEHIEAIRRAEEVRIAREEEKHRIFMEEERRKEAAKQKLIELEERIAKRQAEAAKGGNSSSTLSDERALRRHDAFEDKNNMTTVAPDTSGGNCSPRRDAPVGDRVFPRKELYGVASSMPYQSYYKPGSAEQRDELNRHKGQKWNISGEVDSYCRNNEFESEYHENLGERYGDAGWGQGLSHPLGNTFTSYPEGLYPNSEGDGYSTGRARYSIRQPHVPPPPSLRSIHKDSYRGDNDCPGPSTFLVPELDYSGSVRSGSAIPTGYDGHNKDSLGQLEKALDIENIDVEEHKPERNTAPRCDSQSSLSVSSPPTSPIHLSHDDLDDTGDCLVISATAQGENVVTSGQGNDIVTLPREGVMENSVITSGSVSSGDNEEWTIEHNEELQEQEEYDEDEDGYQEEDEVHEGDDEHAHFPREFDNMHLECKSSPHQVDNLVLCFNEGIEVGMPSDEFEGSARNEEIAYSVPQLSVVSVEGERSFDGVNAAGQPLMRANVLSEVNIDCPSIIFQQTEKEVQKMVVQPIKTPQTSAIPEAVSQVVASNSSGASTQFTVPSSVSTPSHLSYGQTIMSSMSASGKGQGEAPLKLQFGLFSGPSLIPSPVPVPAIQIGSIQMPLHLHPQVGQPLTQMQPSQPLFQFGQLRYSPPISQGVLPLAPQSMSFVESSVISNYSLNQNATVPLPIQQPGKETSANNLINDTLSISDNQVDILPSSLELSHGKATNVENARGSAENASGQQSQSRISRVGDKNTKFPRGFRKEGQNHNLSARNFNSLPARDLERQPQTYPFPSQTVSKEQNMSGHGSKALGQAYGSRGKKYVFAVKNSDSRLTNVGPEDSRPDSNGYQRTPRRQRTQFRVRENHEERQVASSNHLALNDRTSSGRHMTAPMRNGIGRVMRSKSLKQADQSEASGSGPTNLRELDSGSTSIKGSRKDFHTQSQNIPNSGVGNHKRNIRSEETDAPLQSGVVCVFEQPGIEAPSDEDDFIEVRSKKQMLNDRREQREKEIKAKSRIMKMTRKPHSASSSSVATTKANKVSASISREAPSNLRSDFVHTEKNNLTKNELSAAVNASVVFQPLAPIGTPAFKVDGQADTRSQTIKFLQTSSLPVVPGGGKNIPPSSFISESKKNVQDNAQISLGTWGNSRINQQVMALTQTQLDDAMKPAQFDSSASIEDTTSSVSEPSMLSLKKDKSFSSGASPINSLLAGEKIQFGAVTSPTILPPSSRVSHGIGPPGPCRTDLQISRNHSAVESDHTIFFGKEKHSNDSCASLEDCEAEAAASAVAVAAITSDEIVGNRLAACSVSVADTKSFGGTDSDGMVEGMTNEQATHSKAEESLSVALPADLSVETLPISLWPPLPSPQNSSNQMISHFPGGPSSHFPFYEMNPMLGGPIFAFGPHDEPASTQSQSQKSNAAVSGPLGAWQQCHSGVDSFYGPPAGFSGPFISPPGGMPGVQGPPHMVVYNHFAPVGQFGQVGLSFMGTTYIPSGKQPDWKHNLVSTAMVGEGDSNSLNLSSNQRNPTNNMPAPVQHLAPGSPLLPMGSPLAMFDVSPFQSSSDMPVQARWSHIPAPSLQSVPLSMPVQQTEGAHSAQFNHRADLPLTTTRFPETRTSTPSDSGRNFSVVTDAAASQLPDELGLVKPASSTNVGASGFSKISSLNTTDGGKNYVGRRSSGTNNNSSVQNTNSSLPIQQKNSLSQQHGNASGYNHQRGGGGPQKNIPWSHHRRSGFQGRHPPVGGEKGYPGTTKMKQIYVAKQTTSGTLTK